MPSLLALPGTPMAGTPTGVRFGVAPARRLLFPLGHRGGTFSWGRHGTTQKSPTAPAAPQGQRGVNGCPGWIRTTSLPVQSRTLCRLSYWASDLLN